MAFSPPSTPSHGTQAKPDTDRETLYSLQRSMRRIAHALDVHSHRLGREVGLTLPQLAVLGCIRDLGEATSRAIAREAHLTPPTVTGILDKLEGKGMVERHRSRDDRRLVHTRLTAAGQRALETAPSPGGEVFRHGFTCLAPSERAQILTAFEKVADLLTGAEPPVDTLPPVNSLPPH